MKNKIINKLINFSYKMNFPFLICTNCNTSEKENLLLKGYLKNDKNNYINDNKKKLNSNNTSSVDNNYSTNNLEIIDYPYSINDDETFQVNSNEVNIKEFEVLNNGLTKSKFFDEVFNEKNIYLSRNNYTVPINTSSGIINNEESITQNKKLLKNLYSKNKKINENKEDNNINDKDNKNNDKNKNNYKNNKIPFNNNIKKIIKKGNNNNIKIDNNEEKRPVKGIKKKKIFNSEINKLNCNYKNRLKKQGINDEYQGHNSEIFFTKSNQIDSQFAQTETHREKTLKVKTKINLKKGYNLKINKINLENKKTNKNKIIKKSRLPIFTNTEETSKNKKNRIINTNELYFNKKNNIKEGLLFKNRLSKLKNVKSKNKKNKEKTKDETKIFLENSLNIKPYLSFRQKYKGENLSSSLTKSKNKPIFLPLKLYKNLLLNKTSKKSNNFKNIYLGKNQEYTNFINIIRTKNKYINLSSKTYLNPFESFENYMQNSSREKIK